MVDITIFELHLPEAQFNAPFASAGERDTVDEASTERSEGSSARDEASSGSGSPTRAVAAVLALLGLALLAAYLRRSRSGDREPPAD